MHTHQCITLYTHACAQVHQFLQNNDSKTMINDNEDGQETVQMLSKLLRKCLTVAEADSDG